MIYLFQMVIFHSYVSLPEGTCKTLLTWFGPLDVATGLKSPNSVCTL